MILSAVLSFQTVSKQNSAYRMALTAWGITQSSNGQTVEKTVKNKDTGFDYRAELEKFLMELIDAQEGICAISGISLQYDGSYDDDAMLCSLDRIDSNGHYQRDNLQIVCRFINKWKSDTPDEEFRRLLRKVRDPSGYIPG